ncbi:S1 family peptidase [Actinokineospora sp. NBRC 105648]|uniref:S1 family peptidase n=1 Tax=Actinokineospora sp. NBRC 105648 TaxID=3032206 RepID=UPI0024A02A7A|nr:S1 family peptidase [Actinokineospora sp. NBRC 105648]GLZ39418.1 hypothetical protein Acsp05_30420 [Actinokineospora sp. NBRC 105648]
MRVLATLTALVLIVLTAPTAAAGQILVGGDRILLGTKQCVIGFNAHNAAGARSIITTGTCSGTSGPLGVVPAPAGSTSTPLVRNGPGTTTTVKGATEAPIGAPVCRYGPTTGWRCGTIQAKNQTVNFPGGTLTGLTRTNLCVEPGDTGAPVMSGGQAQGIIVGGSGNCTSGGTGYFAPLKPVLSAYSLILYTG